MSIKKQSHFLVREESEFDTRKDDARLLKVDAVQQAIVLLAVSENFILSIINRFISVSASVLIFMQATITVAALLCALAKGARGLLSCLFLVGILCLGMLVVAAAGSGALSGRFAYDATIVPTFALLGSTVGDQKQFIKRLMLVVLCVAIWEQLLPSVYVYVVQPGEYYLITRSWVAEQSEFGQSSADGLYIGSSRAGGSVFSLFGFDHRAGSIFLEPLSLGYFSIISIIYLVSLSKRQPYAYWLVSFMMALMADARTSIGILIVVLLFSMFIEPFGIFVYLIIVPIIFSVFFIYYSIGSEYSDTVFRLGITYGELAKHTLSDLMVGFVSQEGAADSGILYIIGNCGLAGLFIVYVSFSGILAKPRQAPIIYCSMLVYVVVASFFGGAFFSIKTAALVGFLTAASHRSSRNGPSQ